MVPGCAVAKGRGGDHNRGVQDAGAAAVSVVFRERVFHKSGVFW